VAQTCDLREVEVRRITKRREQETEEERRGLMEWLKWWKT
jgi:hypothetical protein